MIYTLNKDIIVYYGSNFSEFAVTPSSVTIKIDGQVEQEAIFRCRHERTDTSIIWLINRKAVQQHPDVLVGSFRDINDSLVQTVTIPAIPRYNESEVVCVATFLDGSPPEETPPVALIISGTVSATMMSTVTAIAATLPPPTTPLPALDLPTAKFTVLPTSLNKTVEQRIAVFYCQHKRCDGILWNVNNRSADNVTNTPLDGGGFNSTLTIETRLDLSGSTVQCVCVFFRNTPELSASATLLVQGNPGEVKNLAHKRDYSSNAITTRWTPSPSLNLTDINPDIMYDVELFMITCRKNVSISNQSVSGNNVTNKDLDLMQIYVIFVGARNNVPNAVNGLSAKLEESFMSLNKHNILFKLARNSQVIMTVADPIPFYFTLILNSIDGYGYSLATNITITRNGETVKMQIEPVIPTKLLLNASIMAYGCEVHTETINELSTHDIQNVTVSSPLPGRISVTGDFVDGSTATGVLIIVYSLSNESDVLEDVQYIVEEKTESYISIDVTGLSSAEYGLSLFALEDGIPFPRVVALPKNVRVTANGDRETQSWHQTVTQYKLKNTSTGVCVNCTFLDSSTTGCVVVVHQRISQLNSSGLMNIVSSRKFNRSGNRAYGCVERVNLKDYQVGVMGVKVRSSIAIPNVKEIVKPEAIIIGTTLGFVVLPLIAVLVLAVMVIVICKFFRKRCEAEAGIIGNFRVHSDSRAVRMRRGSGGSNEYVELPLRKDISEEEEHSLVTLPLPSGQDTEDLLLGAQPMSESFNLGGHLLFVPRQEINPSSPDHDHTTPDNDTSDPTYAQPILPKSSKPVSPAVAERVVYDDIDKFQNMEGVQYAPTKVESCSKGMLVDNLHRVVYSKIQPHSVDESDDRNVRSDSDNSEPGDNSTTGSPNADPSPQSEQFTLELLLSYLLPMASKWRSLGEALSLDEDLVDEISTNNETDEACLRVMLEYYMMRSDLMHNWEEIKAAERKVKEESVPRDQAGNIGTTNTKSKSDNLKPAIPCGMSLDSGYRSRIVSDSSTELVSSSLSALVLEDPSSSKFPHLRNDPNVYTSESQQSKVAGVLEALDNMQPQTGPITEEDYSEKRSGIQEHESSSTSSVIDGSNNSYSKHATINHIKPSHISDTAINHVTRSAEFNEIYDGVDEGENGIETKWRGNTAAHDQKDSCRHKCNDPLDSITGSLQPTAFVKCEDPGVAVEDFKSEFDVSNAPGSETTHSRSSHGQCTLQVTKDRAAGHTLQDEADCCDFDSKLLPHIPGSQITPCYLAHHNCSLLSFVTNKDLGEEPCTRRVASKVRDSHQESCDDMADYRAVLMKQLGIGEQKLSLGADSSKTDTLFISDKGLKSTVTRSSNSTTEYKQSVQKAVVRKSNCSSTRVTRQAVCAQMISSASKTTYNPLLTRSRQTGEVLDSKVSHCRGNCTLAKHSCKLVTHSRTPCKCTTHHMISLGN